MLESNFILHFCFSLAIYDGAPLASKKSGSVEGECSHVGSVNPEESIVGIVQAVHEEDRVRADAQADTAQSPDQKRNSPGWVKRYANSVTDPIKKWRPPYDTIGYDNGNTCVSCDI
jgi:hypothetical protein